MHVLLGQGDYHPAKKKFHGGEQVPIQGIIILKLETNLTGKPENFTSRSENLPDKSRVAGDKGLLLSISKLLDRIEPVATMIISAQFRSPYELPFKKKSPVISNAAR